MLSVALALPVRTPEGDRRSLLAVAGCNPFFPGLTAYAVHSGSFGRVGCRSRRRTP
ncbi:hypothetical protein B4113_3207 [Geobacillus sp. B4113_201601]|nr:hypothetical protein B4113_3207 [Geobacillus sp. B4113_201601]